MALRPLRIPLNHWAWNSLEDKIDCNRTPNTHIPNLRVLVCTPAHPAAPRTQRQLRLGMRGRG